MRAISVFCIIVVLSCFFTALGWIVGRKTGCARPVARWGTAVTLFVAFLPILFETITSVAWRYILSQWSIFHYVPAVLSLAAAVLCVFRPKKSAYVTAFLAGLSGWWLWIWRGDVKILESLMSVLFDWNIGVFLQEMIVSICYAVVLFFCGMGFAVTGRQSEQPAYSAGNMILLSEPYTGQQIPLSDGAELRLGSDAADCHLILELAGEPRCLCSVRWLSGKNCYCITSFEPLGLLYEDGNSVPDGVPLEVQPGTVFLDGQTGQAVFQLGA